jgi:hypothetical protein
MAAARYWTSISRWPFCAHSALLSVLHLPGARGFAQVNDDAKLKEHVRIS